MVLQVDQFDIWASLRSRIFTIAPIECCCEHDSRGQFSQVAVRTPIVGVWVTPADQRRQTSLTDRSWTPAPVGVSGLAVWRHWWVHNHWVDRVAGGLGYHRAESVRWLLRSCLRTGRTSQSCWNPITKGCTGRGNRIGRVYRRCNGPKTLCFADHHWFSLSNEHLARWSPMTTDLAPHNHPPNWPK